MNPERDRRKRTEGEGLPLPTTQYRRRAWLDFQRALDPLGPPKPLRLERRSAAG